MNDRRMFLQSALAVLGVAAMGVPAFGARRRAPAPGRRRRHRRVTRRRRRHLSPRELEREFREAARHADAFYMHLDNALDDGRLHGWRADDVVDATERLNRQINQALREMERREPRDEIRGNVRRCIDAARDIDRTIERHYLGEDAEIAWEAMLDSLNLLADHYNLRSVY